MSVRIGPRAPSLAGAGVGSPNGLENRSNQRWLSVRCDSPAAINGAYKQRGFCNGLLIRLYRKVSSSKLGRSAMKALVAQWQCNGSVNRRPWFDPRSGHQVWVAKASGSGMRAVNAFLSRERFNSCRHPPSSSFHSSATTSLMVKHSVDNRESCGFDSPVVDQNLLGLSQLSLPIFLKSCWTHL